MKNSEYEYWYDVVPVKSVRIVSIEDFDVEACGGTHVKRTKEIDLIKITRTKRIQDGVVRLEFKAGESAQDYIRMHEIEMQKKTAEYIAEEERDKLRDQRKEQAREKIPAILEQISIKKGPYDQGPRIQVDEIFGESFKTGWFYWTSSELYDEYFHINFGEKLVKKEPESIYFGLFEQGVKIRAIIHAGDKVPENKNAGQIAKVISEILGGSGGGNSRFAQGGGKNKDKKDDAIKKAKSMVLE